MCYSAGMCDFDHEHYKGQHNLGFKYADVEIQIITDMIRQKYGSRFESLNFNNSLKNIELSVRN